MAEPTILVVDDEPLLLALVSQALSARGYRVVTITNPALALAVAESSTRFDLLVSDKRMPGIGGPELVHRILKIRPQTPIVFMSGDLAGEEFPTYVEFLSKPFALKDLFTVVERALASRDGRSGFRSSRAAGT